METRNSILKLNNIEVMYQEVILVLKGVSMAVPEGGIVALLGANGAGKSTTLKAISGLLKHENGEVTDGSIDFMGERIDRKDPEEIAKMGIIQVIEGRRVFEHLTVEENLRVGAHLRKDGSAVKDGLENVYHFFPRLKQLNNVMAGFVSGGEQQMMVMGRAMMAKPKLILLDEPSMGLSPLTKNVLVEGIKSIWKTGLTVLIVEQDASLTLNLVERVYILEHGKVGLEGKSQDLMNNEEVKRVYFQLG